MGCIVLGVTGGIAAYKAVDVARQLTVQGFSVKVIMTESATHLVGADTFRAITANPVALRLFEEGRGSIQHISLAREADLVIIAPATANILAKMAHGIADDLLSTTLLAVRSPVMVVPAMNTYMYEHPATQANLRKLEERGVHILGPAGGSLACGEEGRGRMVEPSEIVEAALEILGLSSALAGKKVLITAAGTREYIDPVRYISNRSSGKMGYALAEVAHLMGADVILVSGPTYLEAPQVRELVRVTTAAEMRDAVMDRVSGCAAVVMAAAVADFAPREMSEQKVKKGGKDGMTLDLEPTVDILKELVKSTGKDRITVGFAAETGDLRIKARAKLDEKKVDLLVANDVSREDSGFDSDYNRAILLFKDGKETELDLMPKRELARHIWDAVLALMDR